MKRLGWLHKHLERGVPFASFNKGDIGGIVSCSFSKDFSTHLHADSNQLDSSVVHSARIKG